MHVSRWSYVAVSLGAVIVSGLEVLVVRPCTPEQIAVTFGMYASCAVFLLYIASAVLGRASRSAAVRIATAVVLLLSIFVIGPNVAASMAAERQKTTMRRLENVAEAFEAAKKKGVAPGTLDELERVTGIMVPRTDGWGQPLSLFVVGRHYTVLSCGECGEPDLRRPNHIADGNVFYLRSKEGDLVIRDGKYVTWPEGTIVCF